MLVLGLKAKIFGLGIGLETQVLGLATLYLVALLTPLAKWL